MKQRLVGGITLFLLGVLIIPMVLDGPPPGRFDEARDVNAKPGQDDDVVTFRPPPKPAHVSLGNEGDSRSVTKPSSREAAPVPAKPTGATPVSVGWIVQVGIFSSKSNADGLISKLSKKGFDARSEALKGKKGTVYRVYVGPVPERKKADRTRTSIQALFGLKGLVKKRG